MAAMTQQTRRRGRLEVVLDRIRLVAGVALFAVLCGVAVVAFVHLGTGRVELLGADLVVALVLGVALVQLIGLVDVRRRDRDGDQ